MVFQKWSGSCGVCDGVGVVVGFFLVVLVLVSVVALVLAFSQGG